MEEGKITENMDEKRQQVAGRVDQVFLLLLCGVSGSGMEQVRLPETFAKVMHILLYVASKFYTLVKSFSGVLVLVKLV